MRVVREKAGAAGEAGRGDHDILGGKNPALAVESRAQTVAGLEGGFSRIVVGQQSGGNRVAVFTSGSRLDGHPEMYVDHNMEGHSHNVAFSKAAEFEAIAGARGVDVATSANPISADLVVSGNAGAQPRVSVFDLVRPSAQATKVVPVLKSSKVPSAAVGAVGGR